MENLVILSWIVIGIAVIIGVTLLILLIRFLWSVPNELWRIGNTLDDIADLYYKENKNHNNGQENRQ